VGFEFVVTEFANLASSSNTALGVSISANALLGYWNVKYYLEIKDINKTLKNYKCEFKRFEGEINDLLDRHNVPIIKTHKGIRKLTPKECFLLQGFPKKFRLGHLADSNLYHQAGNSVTVPVIEKVAEQIVKVL
jgi:site-specific DNA-cytosine methylase